MKKLKKANLIYVLCAMVILLSLFIPIFATNSWFTSGDNVKIECIVQTTNIKVNVYQHFDSSGDDVLIDGYKTQQNKTYIDLTNEDGTRTVACNTSYTVKLLLKNTETGDDSMYVRYKIVLYYIDADGEEVNLQTNISGYDIPTASKAGFVPNADGYYYYKNNSGDLALFEKQTSAYLLTTFVVPYSEFENIDGTNSSLSGATLRMKVVVEGSATGTF